MKTNKLISSLLFLSVFFGFADTDKYRIMIADNPSSTITIGWNQVSGNNSIVYFDSVDHGTNHLLYTNSKTVDRTVFYKDMDNRFVRLSGLSPNTNYYFIIKDSNSTSQRFWFRTAPDDDSRLSFIAGGDSRNNRNPRENANILVSKLKPHAVFFGGDMTDDNNAFQWQNWFDDWQATIASDGRMFPIIPARGNHESDASTIYNLFDTPNSDSYYAITFGNNLIRAYTLNTEISVLGNQKTWLENDLSSPSHANVKWKMAQYHKPMRPHSAWKAENNNQYNAWAQLFYDEQVRLVVECDSHMSKTTWPVMPTSGPDNDEGFVTEQVNGTVYTGEGCWGAPLRPNDDDKSWTRNSGSFNQFKLIFVDPLKIEFRTINVNNAIVVGEVSNTDPFTLPSLLDVFSPTTGDVITIKNAVDSTCPEANIPCDDGNPLTAFDIEDGTCNCDGLDINLIEEFTTTVSTGNDDAEEDITTGSMYLDSSDLELIYDSSDQIVGVRFDELSIPNSATIVRAYVQFTSDNYSRYLDPTDLVIHGELASNSNTFSSEINNISARQRTINSVSWTNIKRWGSNDIAGFYERTPNLKPIIDEVIAQPGWTSGNSISFMLTGSGRRTAGSYEGNSPAKLKIIYYHNCPILDVSLSAQGICNELTDTFTQDITVHYINPPSTGNLNVNGQLFPITTSPQTITLTNLDANGFEVDLNVFFTDDPTCNFEKLNAFEAPSICSLGNIPDNLPNDAINLALLPEATLSGSVISGKGTPLDILYDPAINDYFITTAYNEYGVSHNLNIGRPDVHNGYKWQVNWPNVKYINYITFGGTYPNQPQPNTKWRISYRYDGNWIILQQGQGGWIDSGIYQWGGATQNPIEADALRVQLYSDGFADLVSIHLRGRGGISNNTNDNATTPKATLIQYLSPGNNCGVPISSNTIVYCDSTWIYNDGPPDEFSGDRNIIIANGTFIIDEDNITTVNDMEIRSGATVIVKEGASLIVNGNLINNGALQLESISTKFSNLIVKGTSTGNVSYKRHINAFINGPAGNDLVSSPFTGQTFENFSLANPNLYENPENASQKLFGPFDEPTGEYLIYSTTSNATTTLNKGMGYRAARDANEDGISGTTITFTGNVETEGFTLPITESLASFSGWNLIGNPYPSYIDFTTFFNLNQSQLDIGAYQAIYGYQGDTANGWTILNNLSTGQLIAPGQGFFVKTKPGGGIITFTSEMRVKGASDDFISGRNSNNNTLEGFIKLEINNSNSDRFNTRIHFHNNATAGLDLGYDAALFQGNVPDFSIYSKLVEDNAGSFMAIQALGTNHSNNIPIALGINAQQGNDVTISISESTLPISTNVYLEDTQTNTFTLLTDQDYTFTTFNDISGIGRFYLRFELNPLHLKEHTINLLKIYTSSSQKAIIIDGLIQQQMVLNLYDINGKIVNSKKLDNYITEQIIDVSQLSTGIYLVEVVSQGNVKRIEKLIIQ
ncbi:fibronectin type III domain-containing protein [Winogradskyella bathintestinalis]|uniref:Fibronectin type III domain-containing protein n=1 Tax=Winogradskyella bathintestinalis TaxID=3035208 RepID=A0ABT7ZX56_9FLAO|nr:fibronectin type III domain-containing protein [Winogradskyella bathintestinalis]MDN3493593.1 fibronectin type III domain-containing protein [Winogradskyella bathintestinalis]